jgi:hypothetical protein
MCCMSGGTKTMTKINAEGAAWGTGKIRLGRRSWLILPVGGVIPEGFKFPTLRIISMDDADLMLPEGPRDWLPGNVPSCLHTGDRLCIVPP